VEVQRRRLGLCVPAPLPSCAGTMQAEKERVVVASGGRNVGFAATSRDARDTALAAGMSRYRMSRNRKLLLPFPRSPKRNEKTVMRSAKLIALQSAGSKCRDSGQIDSCFPLSVCKAQFNRKRASWSDARQIGKFRSGRVTANEVAQKRELRRHCFVPVVLQICLPVATAFTEAEF
jgi:hypothetical protein